MNDHIYYFDGKWYASLDGYLKCGPTGSREEAEELAKQYESEEP